MKEEEQNKYLSGDRALVDPKDDRLGYAPFAQHLAQSLYSMSPTEGLVVAIHGPWGSGKTTALNFVLHFLKDEIEGGRIMHIPFNPWLFSGTEDIIRRFFGQMIAVLANKKAVNKELRKKIAHFADLISDTPIPYSSWGKTISRLLSAKDRDISMLKKEVEALLKKGKNKILVTIDDIDRLSVEEHREIFQLIKAVADFPNVIYIVVFDREIASKSLSETQGYSGEDFLEKIIQVPFELPLPDKVSLRRLLFENLDKILSDTAVAPFDQTYWTNVYLEGIDHFINTPRDIIRLTNTLSVTYPAVRGEVNPVDFIAIESLRLFSPYTYDVIRKNPESFAGHIDYGLHSGERDHLQEFQKSWMGQLNPDDRKAIERLVKRMFPKLESNYGAEWEQEWRRKLRVCSPEKFPIYFRLSVPFGTVSNSEMMAFLEMTSDADLFGQELLRLSNEKRADGSTRVSEFLERLEDYADEQIPEQNIGFILRAFFQVGDRLLRSEDEGRGLFSYGNDIRIGRNIFKLLKRVAKAQRYELLRDAFISGQSFALMEDMVVSLGQQHGKWSSNPPKAEEDRLVSNNDLAELEKIVLRKIRSASQNGELLDSPSLPSLLYRWGEWAGEEEMKKWVQDVIGSDDGLVRFMERFLHKTHSQTVGDVAVRTIYRLDPKYLEPFVDPSSIIDRARKLTTKNNLLENQQKALNQFLREYDLRAQGKNPERELRS